MHRSQFRPICLYLRVSGRAGGLSCNGDMFIWRHFTSWREFTPRLTQVMPGCTRWCEHKWEKVISRFGRKIVCIISLWAQSWARLQSPGSVGWLCMRRRAVILIIIGMPVLSIICSDVTRLQCEIPGPDYRVIISGRYQSLGETWSWSASITPPAFPIGFAQFSQAGNRLSASDPLQKTLRVGIKRFW